MNLFLKLKGTNKTVSTKSPKKKWSLFSFIIWGFNFTVGYAFIIGLNKSYSTVGIYMPLIIFICGIIALCTGLSFARLSTYFSSNGGAYLYIKRLFKKEFAFVTGMIQYIQAPFVSVSAFFGMIWAISNIKFTANGSSQASFLDNSPYIALLILFLFVFFYMVMLYGFASTTITLYFLWFIKWLIILFSIGIALFLVGNYFLPQDATWGSTKGVIPIFGTSLYHNKLSPDRLITAIFTFFFGFGGFEGIAVVSEDLENPKKNMPIALLTIICLTIVFYLFYSYVTLGSLGSSLIINGHNHSEFAHIGRLSGNSASGIKGNDVNPINLLIQKIPGFKNLALLGVSALVGIVLALVIGAQWANKSTSRLMNGWVNARIIASIAADGFLPRGLARPNKYGQFQRALLLDTILFFILTFVFYVLYLFTHISISDLIDLYTAGAFLQYIFVAIAALKIWLLDHRKRFSILTGEAMVYAGIIIFLVFFLLEYFVSGFYHLFTTNLSVNTIGIATTTLSYFIFFIIMIIIYITSKALKWQKSQEEIDSQSDLETDYASHYDLTDVESRTSFV